MSWTSRLKRVVTKDEVRTRATTDSKTRSLPPVAPVDAATLSVEQLVDVLREDLVLISEEKLTGDEIDPEGHLFDFGYVDSLSAVVFLARIEERFGAKIEDVELLDSANSIRSIADRIRQAG